MFAESSPQMLGMTAVGFTMLSAGAFPLYLVCIRALVASEGWHYQHGVD
jgi:hypothetical protein